jgi:hypothetical protein
MGTSTTYERNKMKDKSYFVGIQVLINQEKTLTNLKVFIFEQLEAHLGNLEFLFGPIVCLYIFLIYPKVRVYVNFQFIDPLGNGILCIFFHST